MHRFLTARFILALYLSPVPAVMGTELASLGPRLAQVEFQLISGHIRMLKAAMGLEESIPHGFVSAVAETISIVESHSVELTDSPFIAALDPDRPAFSPVQKKSLSVEFRARDGRRVGWQKAVAPFPTLFWENSAGQARESIPVFSVDNNSLQMLHQQNSAGILFLKIAEGWHVQFSGRADEPKYFDSHLKFSNSAVVQGEFFAVFPNAQPGSHFIILDNPSIAGHLVVPLPVLIGSATFLDASQIQKYDLKGKVLNELDEDPEELVAPSVPYKVQLFSPDSKESTVSAYISSKGRFHLKQFYAIPNYPLILDVVSQDEAGNHLEYLHRYQVFPEDSGSIILRRISDRKILHWAKKGPGQKVNPQSSLIVATLQDVVDEHHDSLLVPKVESVFTDLNIDSDVYTISPSVKQLPKKDRLLQLYENRMVVFNVSGLPLAKVIDEKKINGDIWSRLVLGVTPGVVLIIDSND